VIALEDQATFTVRCTQETLGRVPTAMKWVDSYCDTKWDHAVATAPMVDALLGLAPEPGEPAMSIAAAKTALADVNWLTDKGNALAMGTLGDLTVALLGTPAAITRISFSWQETGAQAPYDLIEALRMRGLTPQTLGCPQFGMASAGQEKVMQVAAPNRTVFTLTVYDRAAPTGIDWGVYEVDADVSGSIPTQAQLRNGAYPGGGGRAWATEATVWVSECADPE
jgi:hypothetical protein